MLSLSLSGNAFRARGRTRAASRGLAPWLGFNVGGNACKPTSGTTPLSRVLKRRCGMFVRFGERFAWRCVQHSGARGRPVDCASSGLSHRALRPNAPSAVGRMPLFAALRRDHRLDQLQRRTFTAAARPTWVSPYIQLMRADKPIGSLLLMWPGAPVWHRRPAIPSYRVAGVRV